MTAVVTILEVASCSYLAAVASGRVLPAQGRIDVLRTPYIYRGTAKVDDPLINGTA